MKESRDGTLYAITYAGPKGSPVAAYLVGPKGKGPFAAVLFGHWANGTRAPNSFPKPRLTGEVARSFSFRTTHGTVHSPGEKRRTISISQLWTARAEIQAVVYIRRGIDARPDADPKRLAYVGHNYGAQWGSILSAIDKRMKTSLLMAGVPEIVDTLLRADDPGVVELLGERLSSQSDKPAIAL